MNRSCIVFLGFLGLLFVAIWMAAVPAKALEGKVPVWRYTWTTAVGCLPITAIAVYFGTQLDLLSGLF